MQFPKTNSHSDFFVAIVVTVLLLLLLQQDETNVKIFLPVATATDKNTRLHCQLPSLSLVLLACLVVFLETQKNKNENFPSQ
jgi:hypothetical protein